MRRVPTLVLNPLHPACMPTVQSLEVLPCLALPSAPAPAQVQPVVPMDLDPSARQVIPHVQKRCNQVPQVPQVPRRSGVEEA